jgi:hypothetical protein
MIPLRKRRSEIRTILRLPSRSARSHMGGAGEKTEQRIVNFSVAVHATFA